MKKIFLVSAFFMAFCFTSKAQVDVKLNPIAILFGGFQLSAEYPFSKYGAAEIDVIAGEGAFGLIALGKYYFKPEYGADKVYIGAFAGFIGGDSGQGGGGFITGYKWLSAQGVSFELAIGIGRGSGDLEVFPYGKLQVGYRFGNKD